MRRRRTTPRSAASHLVLNCLLRPVCPNTYGKYGINLYSFAGWSRSLLLIYDQRHLFLWLVWCTCGWDTVKQIFIYFIKAPDKALFFQKKIDIFLILHKNICCGYSLEAPLRGASNEYPQYMFSSRNQIDHEIFSTVILSLPLIQEGQLSVSGERMCTILVNRLED